MIMDCGSYAYVAGMPVSGADRNLPNSLGYSQRSLKKWVLTQISIEPSAMPVLCSMKDLNKSLIEAPGL